MAIDWQELQAPASRMPENCDCKGIGGDYCLGKIICEEENDIDNCIPLTCETKSELLGTVDITQEKNKGYTVLIIDASKSMEGANMESTIKASKNFVQKLEEHEYVAIIEFNEKAQTLTDFTNDKTELFKSIDLISPRGRTRFYEPFFLTNKLFETIPKAP